MENHMLQKQRDQPSSGLVGICVAEDWFGGAGLLSADRPEWSNHDLRHAGKHPAMPRTIQKVSEINRKRNPQAIFLETLIGWWI